jgi:hypothetical protein
MSEQCCITDSRIERDTLFHVLSASIAKHLCGARSICDPSCLLHHLASCASWVASVIPETLQATWVHLLETHNQNTVSASMADNISCQVQSSGTSTAVIVDVVNWDLGHAKLVEDSLTASGIAVAVACDTLVDIVVVDLGVEHGLDTSFETELSVVDLASGLDELGHAHAEDVAWLIALDNHCGGCVAL